MLPQKICRCSACFSGMMMLLRKRAIYISLLFDLLEPILDEVSTDCAMYRRWYQRTEIPLTPLCTCAPLSMCSFSVCLTSAASFLPSMIALIYRLFRQCLLRGRDAIGRRDPPRILCMRSSTGPLNFCRNRISAR